MTTKLMWGIIGAGTIARAFADGVARTRTGTVLAIGSRSQDKANQFAAELKVPRAYGSYDALLADRDVQAVYIATPHPQHALWAIRAAEAGKHLLVEKPIAVNYPDAQAIIEAARANDVFLMEAFMYRCHPQTRRLIELIRGGAIGQVRAIQATFSFQARFNPASRLFANELAGGGILDVGCYTTSISRLIAGVAAGRDFADPIAVTGSGHLNEQTGIDEYAVGTLKFPGDIVATIAAGVALQQDNVVRIFGTTGNILVPAPWLPARQGGTTKIIVNRNGQPSEEVVVETEAYLYGLEADTVAANLDRREAPSPAMSWLDTLGNMKTLDAWRAAVGVVYDFETPQRYSKTTVAGRPLSVNAKAEIPHARINGLSKPVSRLVMGVDNQRTMPHAAIVFDDFFGRGGTAFDTAYVYGGGTCERMLGAWVNNRNVRQHVVIIGKGAHTPLCDPKNLTLQLHESLDRLQSDYLDIYIMHRDNLDVPVGEFVDVLNEHVRAGRIRLFGGSNWTLERIDQANAYAQQHGLQGMSVISNQFSLARMVDPVWPGCLSASDPASRAWFTRTQTPLLPWSSQARGFFLPGRADPNRTDDKELVRCWYSADNFQRLARARELASNKGVEPINIALAYVLNQPFPTFPLIGPRTLAETRSSLKGVDVALSPQELAWLNLDKN